MGVGLPALTDSPTARPGRSLCSRSGGREGGWAGFPAGGAEPALEKEKEEKGREAMNDNVNLVKQELKNVVEASTGVLHTNFKIFL